MHLRYSKSSANETFCCTYLPTVVEQGTATHPTPHSQKWHRTCWLFPFMHDGMQRRRRGAHLGKKGVVREGGLLRTREGQFYLEIPQPYLRGITKITNIGRAEILPYYPFTPPPYNHKSHSPPPFKSGNLTPTIHPPPPAPELTCAHVWWRKAKTCGSGVACWDACAAIRQSTPPFLLLHQWCMLEFFLVKKST